VASIRERGEIITVENVEWNDDEDDCNEQQVTTNTTLRSCEYEGCSNEAIFECEGIYCDGSGWVCSLHWNDIDSNYLKNGIGCHRCWQEVGIGDAWVVTISDRRVPPSISGELAKCWNGCKDEKTGDIAMMLPIIMNDENYDYCSKCCTAWVIPGLMEGEI